MQCPVCGARMSHQGYFAWSCGVCGHRCHGSLPGERDDKRQRAAAWYVQPGKPRPFDAL